MKKLADKNSKAYSNLKHWAEDYLLGALEDYPAYDDMKLKSWENSYGGENDIHASGYFCHCEAFKLHIDVDLTFTVETESLWLMEKYKQVIKDIFIEGYKIEIKENLYKRVDYILRRWID